MLKKLIEWSAQNRLLVILVTLMASVMGIYAALNTPVDAIPDLSDVQVIIETDYMGQGPQIVEEQVTYPLATAMLSVPGAKTVRGYSMFGNSFVYVIFEDGTDMYWARSRVLEYLNYATGRLPAGVRPTIGPDATGVGWVYEYSLVDTTGNLDLAQLRSLQDFFLRYELQSVEGVAEVASLGGFQKQYQIVVDPQKLNAYGVSLTDVRMALERSNADVGGRVLEMGEREYIVRGKGYFKTMDDIRGVPLMRSSGGTVVSIGDVATVQIGPELRRGIAEKNGEGEVVGGIVVMRYGENAQEVINRVRTRLDELQVSLPSGVRVVTEYDRSELIQSAVKTLTQKIWEELLVVALIVIVFLLHVKSSFVAIVTVPVGILLSLLAMYLLGINANIMSLGGIAVAIGVMVDAALVMVENAHKHIERTSGILQRELRDSERVRAVLDAAKEVGPSLFFTLLIVTVSFLPVFALQEVEGRMFRPLALTKTFAMASGALLSVTLVPALMVIFIKGRIRTEQENPISRFFIRLYRPIVRATLRRPAPVLIAGFSLLALTFLPVQRLMLGHTVIPFPQIGSEFMPPLDEGDLLYMPTTLPGVSAQKAKELLQQTDRIIKSFPEVESVFGKVGRAETATDPAPLDMIETVVVLKDKSQWRPGMTRDRLVQELNQATKIPGVTNAWTMPIKNRTDMLATGIKTPVGLKIAGPDLSVLQEIGEHIEGVLQKVDGTRSVFAERALGGSFLDFDIRREEAARYGLTTGDVQEALMTAVGGMQVTTTVEGLERYSVLVRYPRDLRSDLPALRSVLVPTPSGAQVALGQVADIRILEGPSMIKSEDARPNAWVYVDLDEGHDIGSYVQNAKDAVAEQVKLPPGYSLKWSGQFEYMERASQRMQLLVPIALGLIFMLLFIHFKSAKEAILLMVPLPFAVVGAVWLMLILGFNFSIAVGVGMIAVAGLAAETGVVMHVYLDEAMKRYGREGRLLSIEHLKHALEEGAVDRVRPKLMTVLTMIIGLAPIMIGDATGAEIMKRIATPMVGGLVTSTIHTLVMIPALYALIHGKKIGQENGQPFVQEEPSVSEGELVH